MIGLHSGCSQNYEEGANPPPVPPAQAQMPANHPPVDTQAERPAGPAVVSGTISIAPDLAGRVPDVGVLYVIARPAPTGGPPLAIIRVPVPEFPFDYQLTQADAGMMPGQGVDLSELDALYLVAKLDQDGSVGPPQPGDMEGACPQNPIVPGTSGADIMIDVLH